MENTKECDQEVPNSQQDIVAKEQLSAFNSNMNASTPIDTLLECFEQALTVEIDKTPRYKLKLKKFMKKQRCKAFVQIVTESDLQTLYPHLSSTYLKKWFKTQSSMR